MSETETLGKGSYGEVLKIKIYNKEYAIKKFLDVHSITLMEYYCLLKLKHPNILNGLKLEKINLIVDLWQGNITDQNYKLPRNINTAIELFKSLTNGLYALHSKNILHLDIKPSNILYKYINDKLLFCICDFSLSVSVPDSRESYHIDFPCCSGEFVPPELSSPYAKKYVSSKTDVFSLCITFFSFLGIGLDNVFINDKDEEKKIFFYQAIEYDYSLEDYAGEDITNIICEILSMSYTCFERRINIFNIKEKLESYYEFNESVIITEKHITDRKKINIFDIVQIYTNNKKKLCRVFFNALYYYNILCRNPGFINKDNVLLACEFADANEHIVFDKKIPSETLEKTLHALFSHNEERIYKNIESTYDLAVILIKLFEEDARDDYFNVKYKNIIDESRQSLNYDYFTNKDDYKELNLEQLTDIGKRLMKY